MRLALAFLFALALSSVSDAKPAAPPPVDRAKCLGYTATILGRLKSMIEADARYELHEYSAERAAKVLVTFNAQEPVSHIKTDKIMALVDTGEGGIVQVMFLTANCITQIIGTPREFWATTIKAAIGVDA